MLDKQEIVAFIATRDPKGARKFYEDVLGLSLVSDDPYALVFEANGTTIRIQKVDDFEPQGFTVLGWQTKNIDEVVESLAKRKVKLERFPGMDQDKRGIWSSPSGARVAWFKDPDGNTLSLTEH
jgi:catechol 2,3-dioxygenase-like lactoylglutathione lyase family enzyme